MACFKCTTAKTLSNKFIPKQTPKKSPKAYNANINNFLDPGASRHYYTILLINNTECQTLTSLTVNANLH